MPSASIGSAPAWTPKSQPAISAVTATSNVTAFTLDMPAGACPLDVAHPPVVTIDGQKLTAPVPATDRSWAAHFRKSGGEVGARARAPKLRACTNATTCRGRSTTPFSIASSIVSPTGTPLSAAAGNWVASEEKRAIAEWHRQFRGDAQVRDDKDVTDADIANSNLILWGDPASNRVLARIADRLPVKWTAEGIALGGKQYAAATHAPILIFPNPLNPKKYVVLNSGFTFREADYLSNARQTPKLPDYAIVDLSVRPDGRFPGKIVQAGFFNEDWAVQDR